MNESFKCEEAAAGHFQFIRSVTRHNSIGKQLNGADIWKYEHERRHATELQTSAIQLQVLKVLRAEHGPFSAVSQLI